MKYAISEIADKSSFMQTYGHNWYMYAYTDHCASFDGIRLYVANG